MSPLPLRWRIIIALLTLALGITLALSLVANHYMRMGLEFSVNIEMGRALTESLALAKENYAWRKAALLEGGRQLQGSPRLLEAYSRGSADGISDIFRSLGLAGVDLSFESPDQLEARLPSAGADVSVYREADDSDLLRLVVPVSGGGALLGTVRLSELLDVERAVHTYKHLQMEEEDLERGFLLAFLVMAFGVVLVASLIGIRIGFGITRPLYALVRGTREIARDNLDYRIPSGREDEIGLLIESFNRMAADLKENRQRRLDAEKVAAWREIARRLAHEIKNPLTPIQLTVQQIRDKYTGSDEAYRKLVQDCTEIVTEEVENLRGLVQEFANFARMPGLSLARHGLNDIVSDTVRLYPDVRVRLDLEKRMPDVELDPEQMRRVLINLIENGIDASGDGATIAVCTRFSGDAVELQVTDSGPGVPEGERERIFQPYVSTKASGMGLGLAVVRSVVEEHGGSATVEEGPDGGARFLVRLPLPDSQEPQAEVHR